RGAILDAAAGIFELALAPQLDADEPLLERTQAHERRIADEIDDAFEPRGNHLPRIRLISSTASSEPPIQQSIGDVRTSGISSTSTPARRKYSAATPDAFTRAASSFCWPTPPISRSRICRE